MIGPVRAKSGFRCPPPAATARQQVEVTRSDESRSLFLAVRRRNGEALAGVDLRLRKAGSPAGIAGQPARCRNADRLKPANGIRERLSVNRFRGMTIRRLGRPNACIRGRVRTPNELSRRAGKNDRRYVRDLARPEFAVGAAVRANATEGFRPRRRHYSADPSAGVRPPRPVARELKSGVLVRFAMAGNARYLPVVRGTIGSPVGAV
jgi:hypothetical protein